MREREKYWIRKYNADKDNNFYNISAGGDGGANLVSGYDEETKYKMRIGNKNFFHDHPRVGKLNSLYGRRGKDSPHYGNKYNLGRKLSEETKRKMSESHNPNNKPPIGTGKIWINNGEYNKFVYPEVFEDLKKEDTSWKRGRKKNNDKEKYNE